MCAKSGQTAQTTKRISPNESPLGRPISMRTAPGPSWTHSLNFFFLCRDLTMEGRNREEWCSAPGPKA